MPKSLTLCAVADKKGSTFHLGIALNPRLFFLCNRCICLDQLMGLVAIQLYIYSVYVLQKYKQEDES